MADAAGTSVVDADVPPPYSDTTESEDERYMSDETIQCPLPHEGREMVNMAMPMSVDELFTLLFTNSSFYIDFIQTTRKCTGQLIKISVVCFFFLFLTKSKLVFLQTLK